MNNNKWRSRYKELRSQLTDTQIKNYSLSIANQLLQLSIWDYTFYHLFLTIEQQNEVQTDVILNILQGKDKHIVISKSDFKTYTMQHCLLTDTTIIKHNQWGIPEPVTIDLPVMASQLDVVFVPLLVCDHKGNRLGYGKGFYDRFLQHCRADVLKIGLSFYPPIDTTLTRSQTDVPIDILVVPNQIYSF